MRNLEQIQEIDVRGRRSRATPLALVSLGAAALLFAAVSAVRRPSTAPVDRPDPLAELVAQAHKAMPSAPSDLGAKDVTFPGILSDDPRTTTALAAMKVQVPSAVSSWRAAPGLAAPSSLAPAPPPAADRLSVIPLPAKNVVAPSPLVSRPRDALTEIAKGAISPGTAAVEAGRNGGYQLQASSFRTEPEAVAFATALRERGHHAYTEAGQIAGRGTWFRVRIGPFHSHHEAALYRAEFERKEHLVAFIVDPPRDKGPERRDKADEAAPGRAR